MSIRAISWAFDQEIFSSSQKFVLVVLGNFASETGKAYPSVGTISRYTQLHEDTVRSSLKALVESGVIADTGKRCGATQQVRVYQLPTEACEISPRGNPAKTPKNRGVNKDPEKPGASSAEDLRKTRERPEEDPGFSGAILEPGTKNQEPNGASAPDGEKPRAPKGQLTDAWCAAWKESHALPYRFGDAKDGKAADRLLKLVEQGVTIERIISIAREAWNHPDWFNCKQAASLAGFECRFNDIVQELATKNTITTNYRNNTLSPRRQNPSPL